MKFHELKSIGEEAKAGETFARQKLRSYGTGNRTGKSKARSHSAPARNPGLERPGEFPRRYLRLLDRGLFRPRLRRLDENILHLGHADKSEHLLQIWGLQIIGLHPGPGPISA